MFWVHFVRDFYRAGEHQPGAHSAADLKHKYVSTASSTRLSTKSTRLEPVQDASDLSAELPLSLSTDPEQYIEAAKEAFLGEHAEVSMTQVQEDVLFLAQRLHKMQHALAVSDRGRSAFLSSMSHELRTPLNAIMGFADMMKSGVFGPVDNPTYAQYVTHIHDSGAQLLAKINDLLDIASMDADELKLDEHECVLADIAAELLGIHSHKAFERQQTIHLDVPKEITLIADRSKLLCALSHFTTNALRHTVDGGEITIRARIQADDGLIISMHDAGEGIGEQQLAMIRDALQAEIAYEHVECGGIGLGLSLSKELAQRHGGRLMIDSMRRRGTVVSMILPVARVVSGLPRRRRGDRSNPIRTGEWQLV